MNKIINKHLFLGKMENVTIVATFFSLWCAVMFEDSVEYIIAYFFILSFGILHGANDLTLIQKTQVTKRTRKSYVLILVYYVSFVLASIVLFYVFPSITLLVFVLFSAYHFGEQHLVRKSLAHSTLSVLLFITYGLFILFLLFYTNYELTSEIITTITSVKLSFKIFEQVLLFSGLVTFILGSILLFTKKLKFNPVKELFYLAVFYVVFKTASLLWGFAIYFILWHSIPSLIDQMYFLHNTVNAKTLKIFVLNSFPYWLISVVGLCLILFFFKDNLETSLAFFFSFLAAITFPHVLVIKKLNNH